MVLPEPPSNPETSSVALSIPEDACAVTPKLMPSMSVPLRTRPIANHRLFIEPPRFLNKRFRNYSGKWSRAMLRVGLRNFSQNKISIHYISV
jgi:hypothetical protein